MVTEDREGSQRALRNDLFQRQLQSAIAASLCTTDAIQNTSNPEEHALYLDSRHAQVPVGDHDSDVEVLDDEEAEDGGDEEEEADNDNDD